MTLKFKENIFSDYLLAFPLENTEKTNDLSSLFFFFFIIFTIMRKKENKNKHFSLENPNETTTFNPRNPRKE